MSVFRRALDERRRAPEGRRWLFVPVDQLTDAVGPLSREDPEELGIVLVESRFQLGLRPYHRQRLLWLIASLRYFALEQAARGVAVEYLDADIPHAASLEPFARERGPLRVMRPAERELRADLAPLVRLGAVDVIPNETWMTTAEQFEAAFAGGKSWRMDSFYRHVRRETGVLMQDGKPVGGRFSFDSENRKPWKGDPPAPVPPVFACDPITEEVAKQVEADYARHPGELDPTAVAASRRDVDALWSWAQQHCLPWFGPYQDAISTRSRSLFHTLVSPLLNLGRLLPARVVSDVEAMTLPLASQEGFVRQVLGWREFVHHVHEATDGFRRLPGGAASDVARRPGTGGFERWAGRSWRAGRVPARIDGGATPARLEADVPLPEAFWGTPSGLACLDAAVRDVWETGYTHHINRLMVLANIATLLGVSPRELSDWFHVAFVDAFDWVVEPNVLGMGTFALGNLFTTKPYVSGAAYIHRMSDACGSCRFSPKRDCPITSLYWSFLDRNRDELASNARMQMPLRSLERRSPEKREEDARIEARVRERLLEGGVLTPELLGS